MPTVAHFVLPLMSTSSDTQNHSPYPSVLRLKYLALGVYYNAVTSVDLTNFRSENIIFHLGTLFQNQPPSSVGNITTPLKTRNYYTDHKRILP